MSIFKRTTVYIKECCHCGLRYFGKTTRNVNTYKGSGVYWSNHTRKHKSEIKTIVINVFGPDEKEECSIFCLAFSKLCDIVLSKKWANLVAENGLDGGDTMSGKKHTEESKEKMSKAKAKEKNPFFGKKHKVVKCSHCEKEGGANVMGRWHFDNCKSLKKDIKDA